MSDSDSDSDSKYPKPKYPRYSMNKPSIRNQTFKGGDQITIHMIKDDYIYFLSYNSYYFKVEPTGYWISEINLSDPTRNLLIKTPTCYLYPMGKHMITFQTKNPIIYAVFIQDALYALTKDELYDLEDGVSVMMNTNCNPLTICHRYASSKTKYEQIPIDLDFLTLTPKQYASFLRIPEVIDTGERFMSNSCNIIKKSLVLIENPELKVNEFLEDLITQGVSVNRIFVSLPIFIEKACYYRNLQALQCFLDAHKYLAILTTSSGECQLLKLLHIPKNEEDKEKPEAEEESGDDPATDTFFLDFVRKWPIFIKECNSNGVFMHELVAQNRVKLLSILIDTFPDLDVNIKIRHTTEKEHEDNFILFYENPDLNSCKYKWNPIEFETLLHHAIRLKRTKIIEMLLAHPNIDIDIINMRGISIRDLLN